MKLKTKMLKTLISVLCAATIATSGAVASVGAVSVAPNMANDQALLDGVETLNSKIYYLKHDLNVLRIKLSQKLKTTNPNDGDFLNNLQQMHNSILHLVDYCSRVKRIEGVNDKNSVDQLCLLIDEISSEFIDQYAESEEAIDHMINILIESDDFVERFTNKIQSYRQKMDNCVKSLVNNNINNDDDLQAHVSNLVKSINLNDNNNNNNNINLNDNNNNNNNNINLNDNNNNNNNINLKDDKDVSQCLEKVKAWVNMLEQEQKKAKPFSKFSKPLMFNFMDIMNEFDKILGGSEGGIYYKKTGHDRDDDVDIRENGEFINPWPLLDKINSVLKDMLSVYDRQEINVNIQKVTRRYEEDKGRKITEPEYAYIAANVARDASPLENLEGYPLNNMEDIVVAEKELLKQLEKLIADN